MKNHRLFIFIALFMLTVFFTGCAKLPLIKETPAPAADIAKQPAAVPPEEKIEPPAALDPFRILPGPPVDQNAVGCVLPLSGRFADTGNKALDAFLLSAEIFNPQSSSRWKIIAADSGESIATTRAAIERLATREKVMAIIAVTGAAEALEAALEAQRLEVPLILITPREGVTEANDYVFQHFLTPTQQVKALARYALDGQNVAIFSILYPDDDYGREMTVLFQDELRKAGGRIDQAVSYSKSQTDFTEQINKITNNRITQSKIDAARRMAQSKKDPAADLEAKISIPVPFEALFIPDSHFRVQMIASQLAFYDVTGIKLLGTSLWHSPDLLKSNAGYLEGAVFADSFSVNSFLREANDFIDIYYAEYSREPGNVEALAYDTMELVLNILEGQRIQTRKEFVEALLAVDRYPGATGLISFAGSRTSQKTPFILQVRRGKIEQVK